MKPTDVLALTALVFVCLMGSAGLVSASQGRNDGTAWPVISALGAALIAGALGIVAGRNSKNDPPE